MPARSPRRPTARALRHPAAPVPVLPRALRRPAAAVLPRALRPAALVPVLTLALAAPAGASSWSGAAPVPDGAVGAPAATAARAGATAVQAPDGTTWVGWVQSTGTSADAVLVARRAPDGTWGATQTVATRSRVAGETGLRVRGPALDVSADGRPVVLWSQATGDGDDFALHSARRQADGGWSAPEALGTESPGNGGFDGSVSVHHVADGRTVAAWRTGSSVRAAVLGTDGSWSSVATLGDDLQRTEVDVASDAEGAITVVWAGADGAVARTRPASGDWGARQDVGPDAASTPRVVADAQGELVAVWASADDDTGDATVEVARRATAGSPWTVEAVQAEGAPERAAPDVAMDRHGDATVVWSTAVTDGDGAEAGAVVRSRVRRPDGSWDPPVDVYASPATEAPSAPRIVTGQTGMATVVWTDARFGSPRFARLSAATRASGDATWTAPTALSEAANGFVTVPDNIAADPLGNVALALTPLLSAVVPNATAPVLRELDAAPAVGTDWSARWLPGTFNLRTFVTYLHGAPDGGVFASDGASKPEPVDRYGLRLTVRDAWRDADTGEIVVQHRGVVRMAMPLHFIDIRIVDPTVRIAADGRSARVVASGQGSGAMDPSATGPTVEPFTDVPLIDLDLAAAAVRGGAGGAVRTYVAAPATIAAGDAARYLAYPAGTPYGTFTVTVPATLADRDPTPPGGAPDGGDDGSGSGGSGSGGSGGSGSGDGSTTPVTPGPGAPPAGPPAAPGRPSVPAATTPKTVVATRQGARAAQRTVVATTASRIGARATRTYRVRLVRGGRTVAVGTLRGRRLRLTVRATGRTKAGRARYPRLSGTYVLRSNGGGAANRIPVTTLRVR